MDESFKECYCLQGNCVWITSVAQSDGVIYLIKSKYRGSFGQLILHFSKFWKIDRKTRPEARGHAEFHAVKQNFCSRLFSLTFFKFHFPIFHKLENTRPFKIHVAAYFYFMSHFFNFCMMKYNRKHAGA